MGKWHLGEEVKDRFDVVVEAGKGGFVLPTGPDGEPLEMTAGANPSGCEDWVPVLKNRPTDQAVLPLARRPRPAPQLRPEETRSRSRTPPTDAVVPPFLPDVYADVRGDLAMYMDEVTRLDGYVGEVLAELDRQGVAENTLVIFMSDNGRPFPRCKTTLYDSGVKTPLIARLPGVNAGRDDCATGWSAAWTSPRRSSTSAAPAR